MTPEKIAGDRGRQDDARRRLPRGGPATQRGGAQRVGDRRERVLRDREDDRDDREAHREADDEAVALVVRGARALVALADEEPAEPVVEHEVVHGPGEQREQGARQDGVRQRPQEPLGRPPRAGDGDPQASGKEEHAQRGAEHEQPQAEQGDAGARPRAAEHPGSEVALRVHRAAKEHVLEERRQPDAEPPRAGDQGERDQQPLTGRDRLPPVDRDQRTRRSPRGTPTRPMPKIAAKIAGHDVLDRGRDHQAATNPRTTLGRLAMTSTPGLTSGADPRVHELRGVERREERERQREEHRVERGLERAEDQRRQAELELGLVRRGRALVLVRRAGRTLRSGPPRRARGRWSRDAGSRPSNARYRAARARPRGSRRPSEPSAMAVDRALERGDVPEHALVGREARA